MHHYEIYEENPGFVHYIDHLHFLTSPQVLEVGKDMGAQFTDSHSISGFFPFLHIRPLEAGVTFVKEIDFAFLESPKHFSFRFFPH